MRKLGDRSQVFRFAKSNSIRARSDQSAQAIAGLRDLTQPCARFYTAETVASAKYRIEQNLWH